MKAQINHAQYELVFTQVLDGPLLNHKGLPITNVHFGSREKIHKTVSFSEFKKIEEECQRRVEFKKEQLEFEKKEREKLYKESLDLLLYMEKVEIIVAKKSELLIA